MSVPSVAIVGAGISGLACARRLRDAGFAVEVFDKSRGVGGRLATRRAAFGEFDHGAQYFTARDPRFAEQARQWLDGGVVAQWTPRLAVIDVIDGSAVCGAAPEPTRRYVGVPAMNAIGKALAADLQVRTSCTITRAVREAGGWRLEQAEDAPPTQFPRYDWLLGALPSPQAAALFSDAPKVQAGARARPMVPCWAVLARFEAPLAAAFDAAFVNGSPLTWVARNGTKPGRAPGECWVLHAARDWSARHLELDAAAITAPLLAEFARITGIHTQPSAVQAHRWRYSGPADPGGDPCLLEPAERAGACGDWLAGARVEGAWLSGTALADALIAAR